MRSIKYYLGNTTITDAGCMEWCGALSSDGYPRVNAGNGNGKLHRLVYSHVNGYPDITGRVVRHTCDNPICINPDHLVLGTLEDNVRDRQDRNRTHNQVSKYSYDRVIGLRKEGLTLKEIAASTGFTYKQVDYIVYSKQPI